MNWVVGVIPTALCISPESLPRVGELACTTMHQPGLL
jgi:hypothetical protein